MSRVTELFQGEGAVRALTRVAAQTRAETAAVAVESLERVTTALRDAVVGIRDVDGASRASGFVVRRNLVVTVDTRCAATRQTFSFHFQTVARRPASSC
jgi:hypothetical protein